MTLKHNETKNLHYVKQQQQQFNYLKTIVLKIDYHTY